MVVKAEVVSGAIVASAGVQVIEKQERQADSSEHPANETLMIDKETPIKRKLISRKKAICCPNSLGGPKRES